MPAPLRTTPPMTGPDGLLDPTVVLTLREAAQLCGVHRDKVRYRLRHKGELMPGAHRIDGDGAKRWGVPIGDLVTCGLLDGARVSRPFASPTTVAPAPAPTTQPAAAYAAAQAAAMSVPEEMRPTVFAAVLESFLPGMAA